MADRFIRPIRIEGQVAYVPLTQGYEAVIDACDVHLVDGVNWYAFVSRRKSDGSVRAVYAVTKIRRMDGGHRLMMMHNAIIGTSSGMEVDHVNGDGLCNRRVNLRAATKAQNSQNRRTNANSKSGIKGVRWNERAKKWHVEITANGTRHWIGYFATVETAADAYAQASIRYHGQFGRAG
jgi:hypothetical protein